MISVSKIVWDRPHLLRAYIVAQYSDVLNLASRDEYSREDRIEAMTYVERLASLNHENAADTLQSILED